MSFLLLISKTISEACISRLAVQVLIPKTDWFIWSPVTLFLAISKRPLSDTIALISRYVLKVSLDNKVVVCLLTFNLLFWCISTLFSSV